jgi:protein O-mannosyl-transferase
MKKPWHKLGAGALLAILVFAAYYPSIHGGFVWDDDTHITNNSTLRTADGLRRIWFEPGATEQYYPLTHSVFWIIYHVCGLQPMGFHITSIALHALCAILLWLLLTRLKVRWAWLGAAVFAVHPVCVESVAWMTELKIA